MPQATPFSRLARIPRTYRNIQRLRQIVGVIARYGFGNIVSKIQIGGIRERIQRYYASRKYERDIIALRTEERIRLAFEELGPTFIKFGQILATRPDLIPMDLVNELRRLQDRVPPFAWSEAKREVESELGASIESVFAEFEQEPIAAASIAQVHRARLLDGRRVAVKVRRPGLDRTIRNDLDILGGLAELIEEKIPEARQYSLVAIVREFRKSILREIDFQQEAFHMHKFARNFDGDETVHVPTVITEHSTGKILTMEYIDGAKVNDLEALDSAGLDRKVIAEQGVQFIIKQVFEHGFFHADPHPGNIFILKGNIICMVDYGMMGSVDQERLNDLLSLLMAILMKDVDRIIKLFFKLELVDESVDLRELRVDSQELLDRYYEVPIEEIDIGGFIASIFEVGMKYRVRVPADLLLMGKALATMEGIAETLFPDLDPVTVVRPFAIKQYIKRMTDPHYLTKDLFGTIEEYSLLAQSFPRELRQIMVKLNRGELSLPIHPSDLDRALLAHNRTSNRRVLALLTSAVALGSCVLIASGAGPLIAGLPFTTLLGLFGMSIASALGLVIAYYVLRSGGV